MSVLLISPEPWDAHTVSKHHYAMTLARRGSQVFFLNPPDVSFADITIQSAPDQPNLHIVNAPKVALGLRFYPSPLRRWLERRWLERLESVAGSEMEVIWLFENSRFFDMRFAGDRLKIYHQVDLNQEFNHRVAASTADICFCTTDFIKKMLIPYNPRTFKIHHGVAVPNAGAQELTVSQQNNFAETAINVAYIGNLDIPYLDVALLAELVKTFPGVRFHFVGQYRPDGNLYQACFGSLNVVWWGRVESGLIPAIIERCDVQLVTYLADQYREQLASPHKIMEYLASGKTIVATYTDEYKDKRHLLEMVEDSRSFISRFETVINNLEEHNSTANQLKRIQFAQEHKYTNQLLKIIELIDFGGNCFESLKRND